MGFGVMPDYAALIRPTFLEFFGGVMELGVVPDYASLIRPTGLRVVVKLFAGRFLGGGR